MRYALLFGLVLLAGCATTAGYEQMLNTWMGSTEIDLVRKWGPPLGAYDGGGSRFLTWESSGQVYVPGTAPSYQTQFIGNTAYTTPVGGSPGYTVMKRCRTTFELRNGVVSSWRWDGNACKARTRD
jgi:hypothetical protein